MKQPVLSICICVRNGEEHLERCLQSLLPELKKNKESTSPIELVLVDHSSTDRTSDILERYESEFQEIPHVTTRNLRFDTPGIASVRNYAWRMTSSPWVAFLDSDCTLREGWVSAALSGIKKFDDKVSVAALGGANHVFESEKLIYKAYKVLLPSYIGGHGSTLNQVYNEVKEVDHLPTLNIIYRRSSLENVGGFQEHFLKVGEDLDLSARLKAYGYRLIYQPNLSVEHLLRGKTWDWAQNMYLYGRGRVFFLWNHPERFELKFLMPPLLVLVYLVSLFFPLLFLIVLGTHVFVLMCSTLFHIPEKQFQWKVWLFATLLGWVTHLFYGLGVFRQMLTPWRVIW